MAVYYTYMVVCKDCTLYTGYTNDLVRRVRKHNSGKGAKYTRSRLPVRLVYWEKYASKQQAMQREYAIKQWTRQQKLQLLSPQQRQQILTVEKQSEHATCAPERV